MQTDELQIQWGRRLRAARRTAGLSIRGLERASGVDRSQLSRVENGLAGLGTDARIRVALAVRRRVEDLFPYPDTSDLESESAWPRAASAADAAPSPAPATEKTATGTRRTHPSHAPSVAARGGLGREESPGNE